MASVDTERSNAVEEMRAALADGEILHAADWFRRANELTPGDEDLAVEYAQALSSAGSFDSATLVAEHALEAHPESVRLHCVHGWAESHQEHYERAGEAFAAALAIDPDHDDATVGRANALYGLGKVDESRACLADALGERPESTELRRALARLDSNEGRWEQVLDTLRPVAVADEELVLRRSDALVSLARFAEAELMIEASVRADPQSAAFRSQLGWLHFLRGRHALAAETFARAVELGATDSMTAIGRARALRALGRDAEALAVIDGALAADEEEPGLHIQAGETAFAMHDHQRAKDAFARAAELAPKDKQARKGLKRARLLIGYWRVFERPCRAFDRATRRFFSQTAPALVLIDGMSRLDAPARADVTARVSRYAWRRARVSGATAVASSALGLLWTFALLATVVAVPLVVGRQGGPGGLSGFDLGIAYFGAVWAALLVAGVVLTAVPEGRATMWASMTIVFLYGALAGVAAGAADALGPTAATLIIWPLTANAIALATLLAFATLLVVGERLGLRQVEEREPRTACLHALADLIVRLRDGIVPTNQTHVRGATETLEQAATLLRAHLKTERTGDLRTDAWIAKRADGHAEALRECKKALLSPGVGSVETLRRRLADDFLHIARGHWRHLPWTDPSPAAAKTRRLRARTIARTLLLALGPLALVLVIGDQGWFGLQSDTADKLKLAGLGWAFLSIVMPLDPGFSDKFAALRGGAELLKPGGGSKS